MLSEEPLELEPIELEPIDDTEADRAADLAVLSYPWVEATIRNYALSSFPCCLLDASLNLLWNNRAFDATLPVVRRHTSNLITFFPGSFHGERQSRLYAELRSADAGYSWRGEVQLIEPHQRKIIAILLVGPIRSPESEEEELPAAYLAIVDDISDHHRDLVRGTFSSLLEASLLKDNDTGRHVARVNEYCRILGERISETGEYPEVDFEFVDTISFVAAMHDVGKIGTPDDILNKDGPLAPWEWEVMREHTINGAYILATYPSPMAKQIALFHHEWWDGNGYPYAIAGEMIPLAARIVSLADVYDALRMKRSYKEAFDHHKAIVEIEKGAATHFDPRLARLFVRNAEAMQDVYSRFADG